MKIHATVFRPAITLLCLAWAAVGQSFWIDSVEAGYACAARDYDSAMLVRVANGLRTRSETDRESPRALLTLGLVCWRLELIAYCTGDNGRIVSYGKEALATLERAEKAGADVYITASHKSLVCQLIASLGFNRAIRYGPRSTAELKKAKTANPGGYFSLLAEAVSASQAPALAGGDPEKAVAMLEKMRKSFPDSVDVSIHLARAYHKAGRSGDARELIEPVITANSKNLLARMAAAEAGIR